MATFVPKCLLALAASAIFASAAGAQVIYEPVRSQYGSGRDAFHYGGGDPRAVAHARERLDALKDFGAVREGRHGVGYVYRGVVTEPPAYVVSDRFPYLNAIAYGYTPTDARNEAYANVPRYFRKADLLRSAAPAVDGRSWVVPAQANPAAPADRGRIDVRPYRAPATGPATTPAAMPRPLLVIPKKLLQTPRASDKSVARAE